METETQSDDVFIVDQQPLRAYFNSHGLAVNPRLGLFQRRVEHFERLVCDKEFQVTTCQDERHQVFLFQALFKALVVSALDAHRIRTLSPTYSYSYNLRDQVPEERRATALDDLVCFTSKGRSLKPFAVTDVATREPLRARLAARDGWGSGNSCNPLPSKLV